MFKIETKQQKRQRIIQNIHNDFDSAQDRLLSQAKTLLESIHLSDIGKQEQIADRLMKVGFENVPVVKQVSSLKKEREEKKVQIVKTKEEAELIEYYKQNYPFLKFLTENELDKICKKYNLVYAPVKNYIESVPEKNLAEIERAQMLCDCDKPKEKTIIKYVIYDFSILRGNQVLPKEWANWENPITVEDEMKYNFQLVDYLKSKYNCKKDVSIKYREITKISKSGLFICAPQHHFNTQGLKKKGLGFFDFTVTKIDDPIVFRYVRGGIQVLSKWGLEASDPVLLNPINN